MLVFMFCLACSSSSEVTSCSLAQSCLVKMSQKGPDHGLSVHELQEFNRAESQEHDAAKTKGGTSADLADMQRMGRTQELRVRL